MLTRSSLAAAAAVVLAVLIGSFFGYGSAMRGELSVVRDELASLRDETCVEVLMLTTRMNIMDVAVEELQAEHPSDHVFLQHLREQSGRADLTLEDRLEIALEEAFDRFTASQPVGNRLRCDSETP